MYGAVLQFTLIVEVEKKEASLLHSCIFIHHHPIQSNPIQSNPIQSNPIQSNPDTVHIQIQICHKNEQLIYEACISDIQPML